VCEPPVEIVPTYYAGVTAMPRKSLEQRIKRAKKQGVAMAVSEADEGHSRGSAHAAKKPFQLLGYATFPDRKVSRKAVPGMGGLGRKVIRDLRAAYRAENAASGGGRPHQIRHEEHARPASKVNGRKKAPSQMNLKRR